MKLTVFRDIMGFEIKRLIFAKNLDADLTLISLAEEENLHILASTEESFLTSVCRLVFQRNGFFDALKVLLLRMGQICLIEIPYDQAVA